MTDDPIQSPRVDELTDDQIRDLCNRLRAGEPTAQAEMFLYVEAKLRPLASKVLRLDFPRLGLYAETNDILNEILCKLIPYLRSKGEAFCTGVEPFHKLTGTVLRRTLISLARRHFGSLRAHPLDDRADAEDSRLWQSSGLEGWRSRLRVHELIDKLDDANREVLELALYANLSNAELAKCLGIVPGNASRRLSRAKEELGRLLLADDAEAG